MNYFSIPAFIKSQVEDNPYNTAIMDVNGGTLTYFYLYEQIKETVNFLNTKGIGRNDPVAIVLPNGPLMAAAFLSVASGAASAPLNPGYTFSEYAFFIKDLDAKAVMIQKGFDNPVIQVADQLNIPIIKISPKIDAPIGQFNFISDVREKSAPAPGLARMSDIALILHTSGTTSRPKMVPLTQKNLTVSAGNIANTLQLQPQDRCLNIMPLFHIHGLMAAVMATMVAGGSVVCTPGFFAPKFYQWLQRLKPTWYSAVPTMHQAILNRSKANLDIIESSKLRFIRSSSSSLAPNVMSEMETTFGVPVIEAYGMTEASHQMACNPLPPGVRKPGSVGLPAGPEVAIMDEEKPEFLPKKIIGEVVIRGDNVTLGYMSNQEANENSFYNGWFRTGDQGYLDQDGYLFLTGRLKEIINRGGEKISPREVDEVLLSHPSVVQALAFSLPDPALGEDIAAVVILKQGDITEHELRTFAASRLAPFKVPSKILILDEIPKGPTGKLQRIGLAKKLGLVDQSKPASQKKQEYIPPNTDIEKKICEIWKEVLDIETAGIEDAFRDVGGDSMLATLLQEELENYYGVELPLVDLYAANTVSKQAKLVGSLLNE